MSKKTNTRKARRRQRGAAYAEALIALPIFAAALAGIVGFNNMYSAKLEAMANARRMAWLQADVGVEDCVESSCNSSECGAAEGNVSTGGLDELAGVGSGGFSLGSFLGSIVEFLASKSTNGVATHQSMRPELLGGSDYEHFGQTTLLCNTVADETDSNGTALSQACTNGGLQNVEYAGAACGGGG